MNKWISALFVVGLLFLISSVVAGLFFNDNNISVDSIIVLPLHGIITIDGDGPSFFKGENGISSTQIVKRIKELNENKFVKGIIFEIDSPGGSVVPSQEIADSIKNLQKPNYAVIREVGASGGYWIASSTDKIFASDMSITGSIGVIGSYLEFSSLMEKYGIGYERFVGGKYKDIGTPYRDLSEEEKNLFQRKINLIHDKFIQEISENRKLDLKKVKELATGEIYLGSEAKELKLIDEFGNIEVALENMKKELNNVKINVVYEKKESNLFELLGSLGAYYFGRGFAAELNKIDLENKYKISV